MTVTTTFNGVTVKSRQVTSLRKIYGKVFEITFDCVTTDYTDISNLEVLAGVIVSKTTTIYGKTSIQTTGTKATLVLNGTSYTNCAIMSLVATEVYGTVLRTWKYTVSFAQETI